MKRPVAEPLLFICTALVLAAFGVVSNWYWIQWHDHNGPPPLLNLGLPSSPYTVLFLGTDVNYTWQGNRQIPDPGSKFQGRSDTMLVVQVDPQHMSINGVQIPRDTIADIPGFGRQKINAANALGGPQLAMATASNLLGVPINHYVILNVHGLMDAVNELGGITVDVPKQMSYMDWTAKLKIDLSPGFHTLTGNQAMGFVRFRHDSLGDIGRVQRQEMFMRAFVHKMSSPVSWPHIPRLIEILHENVLTDLSDIDLIRAFNLSRSMPKHQLRFAMIPGRFGYNGTWVPDAVATQEMVSRIYGLGTGTADRSNVTVTVENVSDYPDLDRKVSELLRKNGYSVMVLPARDFAANGKHTTRIIAQQGNFQEAQLVQNDLKCGEIINESIGDIYSKITVVVDNDVQPLIAREFADQASATPLRAAQTSFEPGG